MFIRIKKIKNQEYAYLVSNVWKKRKKASRQKVSRYLGKIYKIHKTKDISLEEFLKISDMRNYIEKTNFEKIIKDLIKFELCKLDFQKYTKNIWLLNNFKVNLKNKTVEDTKTKKRICLEINNNFLCNYTLSKLLNFSPKKNLTDIQIGKELANAFESAGVLVNKEVFVSIAKKILAKLKNTKNRQ